MQSLRTRLRPGRWLVIPIPLLLTGCGAALLDTKGPIGHGNKILMLDSLAIMLAIVIPTIVVTFAFAWWYRAGNKRARYLPDWEFSGSIELVVWSIPLMVIILLGGVTWIGSHDLDPAKPIESADSAPLEIEVVSLDWKWLFIYPEQRIAAVNQLVVPAGVPLHFKLTAASVLNTFFIPQLGSMIYTMNGMSTELWLLADQQGTYRGISGHYSGDGFSDMHFNVRAVSHEQFAKWVNDTREPGITLDSASYLELAKQSIKVAPSTFSTVERNLYTKIVSQELPPAPGPGTERQGAGTSSKAEH